jgi:putative tricarboxylic transport membrane protein
MKRDLYSSLFFFLFAVYFTVTAYTLGVGTWGMPGPGYFPFGAGVIFGFLSLGVMISALRPHTETASESRDAETLQWHNIVLILIGMLVYILVLKKLGFVASTFLLVILFVRIIARERWFKSMTIAVCITVSFHVFFNVLLNAQLPLGLLKFFS